MTFKDDILVVTGGSGFLGSHVMSLIDADQFREVRVIRSKDCDLRDYTQTYTAFKGATLIIHIAGVTGGIEFTKLNQGKVYYDNIHMNTNVIHAAMEHKVKRVISVGSVCSYPKLAKIPFKESEIWDGYPDEIVAPYGLAKKMLIVQGDAYHNQYGLESQVLLMTNLYGPNDTFDIKKSHVVPALIVRFHDALKNNLDEVVLWGDGTPTRDLIFVEDAARAILCALQSKSAVSPINIGSGKEISIKALAETIKELVQVDVKICWDTTKANGQPRRLLDTSRAEKEINFKAKTSLKEGLIKTINWYQENFGLVPRSKSI